MSMTGNGAVIVTGVETDMTIRGAEVTKTQHALIPQGPARIQEWKESNHALSHG